MEGRDIVRRRRTLRSVQCYSEIINTDRVNNYKISNHTKSKYEYLRVLARVLAAVHPRAEAAGQDEPLLALRRGRAGGPVDARGVLTVDAATSFPARHRSLCT